ncbi:hypothetical protein Tco_0998180, partial [Tanacetum coccineum]
MDLTKVGDNKSLQITDFDKLRLDAYESSISYQERKNRWLFLGKLNSRWYGPFIVSRDMKGRAIELCNEEGNVFIVNKQRVKSYQKYILDFDKDDDVTLDDDGIT